MLKSLRRTLYMMSGTLRGVFFIIIVFAIIGIVFYTQQLVGELRQESRAIVEFYANTIQRIASDESMSAEALGWVFVNITQRTNFPLVLTDVEGNPTTWKGLSVPEDARSPEAIETVKRYIERMGEENAPVPIMYEDKVINYLYYGDSKNISQLSNLPYITLLGMGLLVLLAFLGFSSIKQSEQRFIWVGMAKETAHQLGTPISSLMGWLEMLKLGELPPDQMQMLTSDMETDVNRLQKVAARFSQIGSEAELTPRDLNELFEDIIAYFKRRIPQGGKEVTIIANLGEIPPVALNRDLFEWAIENLIKNSVDAVQKKKGVIEIITGMVPDKNRVYIDIRDNGAGVNTKHQNDIFKPGYSTKKRGWGLGLNLARRIVEENHGGRLFLKETRPGEGTTMRILLKA